MDGNKDGGPMWEYFVRSANERGDQETAMRAEATLKLAKEADAILFGAVGDWKYDKLERPLRPEQAILGLRKNLGLFANFRPAICYEQLTHASSLKPELVAGLDILIIRELTGDIYFGQPRGRRESPDGEFKGARFWAKLSEVNGMDFEVMETSPNVPRPNKYIRWNHHYSIGVQHVTELRYDSPDKRFSVYGTYTHTGNWNGWELSDNGIVVKKYKNYHGAMEAAERILKKERDNVTNTQT